MQMADTESLRPSRLLSLPVEVRLMILGLLAPASYERWTIHALAQTCRQLQAEVHDVCIPKVISQRAAKADVYTPHWENMLEFNLEGACWTIADMADPINVRLLSRINKVRCFSVEVVDPSTRDFCESHWERFLNIFARALAVVWIVRRLRNIQTLVLAIYDRYEKVRRGRPGFWDLKVSLPGHPAHGLLYYDVILMLFTDVTVSEDFWTCGRVTDTTRRHYIRGDDGFRGKDELSEWIEHVACCKHCRKRRPRLDNCRRRWLERPNIAKDFSTLQKSVRRLVADLPSLLAVLRPPVRLAAQEWNTDGLVLSRTE